MPLAAYFFLRAVGKGSYGEVSLVRHRQDNRQYVIKKLNLKHASSREREAAEQEAQLLSQLKHPNIVTYRESWEGEDGLLYIVMGFCEGGDLYHKLKEQKGKPLPENQVVEWFVQIAMALQYLHEKHILHRDLKTQNVFLTRTNIIKVGDLGIARVLENQYDMASTLIGTPYYMSPELFSNKPYNYKSDVWALGCCVYEMATLKHAFNAKDMNSLVYRIIEGKLPPMPKDYSPQLSELIRTMLSKKPEERPNVKSILRQPYIKRQISLFLAATKASAASVISVKTGSNNGNITPKKHPSEQARRDRANEEKHLIKDQTFEIYPSEKPAAEPEKNANKNEKNSTGVSIATISKVDIDILLSERRNCKSDHLLQDNKARCLSIPSEVESKITSNGPQTKEDRLQQNSKPGSRTEIVDSKHFAVDVADEGDDTLKLLQPVSKDRKQNDDQSLDSTEKLLASFVPVLIQDEACHGNPEDVQEKFTFHFQPHSSFCEPSLSRQRWQKKREIDEDCSEKLRAVAPRPLPSLPDVNVKTTYSPADQRGTEVTESVNSSKNSERAISEDRPLSARERRRLKQSQEKMFPSVPAARRASHSAVVEAKSLVENLIKVTQTSSDPSISQKKKLIHCLSDDELSSSTSSTDKSDGDSKEGKSNTNEMNDLVQLMTQTLKMDSKENCEHPSILTPASEFKLHRKYRDTLILHGKVSNEPEKFKFEEFPSDVLSGPEKIRRMVEILRSEVVQGLGVKLLEKVYDIMEEDDELKRESAGLLHRETKTILKVHSVIRGSGGQNERSSCLLSTYLAMDQIMHSGVLQLGKGARSFNHSALHQGSGLLSGIPGAGSHPGNLQSSNMVLHFHNALCDYPAGQSRCSLRTSSAPISGRH
ncbi:serine/threonine-protein kinase Nek4 isoform X3 [Terrapene carolina triunguis]|uniref:serine/threonine-protein kinase Nek4 isoform X3 n=1 Tax=Terrapene triunguis TaxID=2587831 RepID=UPI000E774EB8|nr:serine/threonine-protein kinase Nek4 isoform X3 [Terrapene carolina triunguis]